MHAPNAGEARAVVVGNTDVAGRQQAVDAHVAARGPEPSARLAFEGATGFDEHVTVAVVAVGAHQPPRHHEAAVVGDAAVDLHNAALLEHGRCGVAEVAACLHRALVDQVAAVVQCRDRQVAAGAVLETATVVQRVDRQLAAVEHGGAAGVVQDAHESGGAAAVAEAAVVLQAVQDGLVVPAGDGVEAHCAGRDAVVARQRDRLGQVVGDLHVVAARLQRGAPVGGQPADVDVAAQVGPAGLQPADGVAIGGLKAGVEDQVDGRAGVGREVAADHQAVVHGQALHLDFQAARKRRIAQHGKGAR